MNGFPGGLGCVLSVLLLLATAGSAQGEQPGEARDPDVSTATAPALEVAPGMSPEAAAILKDVLPGEAYAVSTHCINVRRVRSVDVLDEKHLLFEARREAWLNRLPMNCRGLRPGQVLFFDQTGSRLCHHDQMVARESGIAANEDFPPRCRLGRFERIEPRQADMLRDQFRQLRKLRRSGRRSG